jgi:hypothetical protein
MPHHTAPISDVESTRLVGAAASAQLSGMVEYCGRCKRRRILTYHVREDIQRLVLLNRWKSGVCASCFDELAEKGGITYSFESLEALSWSDRGAPPRRGSRRR